MTGIKQQIQFEFEASLMLGKQQKTFESLRQMF